MNPLRPPSIPGVRFVSSRDAGTCVVHQFAFVASQELQAVPELLRHLQPGYEVCMQAWSADEAYLEVRRLGTQLQVRTSHHGTSGTWAAATLDDARELLSSTAPHVNGSSLQFTGSYTIYPNDRNG